MIEQGFTRLFVRVDYLTTHPTSISHPSPPQHPKNPRSDYIRSRGVWIAIIFLLVAPLTFLRSLTPLRFTGVFTAVAVAFFALSVILSYALPGLHACSLYEVKAPCTLNAAALVTAPPGVFARLLQVINCQYHNHTHTYFPPFSPLPDALPSSLPPLPLPPPHTHI